MRGKSVAALLINWNGSTDTLEALRSLAPCQSPHLAMHCVVVDNASSATERATLAKGLDELRTNLRIDLVSNTVNVGVPAAYNQAIQQAGPAHDYYLRLDNDVVVDPTGLHAMIAALDTHPNVGIVGGNIKYYHARDQDNGGAVTFDLVRGRNSIAYPAHDMPCDGVLGCIMLMRAAVVRRYAPEVFCGKLFVCTDESELSLRAACDGMQTFYLHQCIGWHKGGASTGKVPFVANYYSIRNWTYVRLCFVRARWPRFQVWAEIVARYSLNLLRLRKASVLGVPAGICMWRVEHTDTLVRTRHLAKR